MTEQARTQNLASLAVVICGALWGIYWMPLRWFDAAGIGAAWIGTLFSAIAAVAVLPWLIRKSSWAKWQVPLLSGLLLGSGFAFYTVALLMTDVVHAILLFYLTPVWSTLGAWALYRERLTWPRLLAIICGFAGMAFILGFDKGLPIPRNGGDMLALLTAKNRPRALFCWSDLDAVDLLSHARQLGIRVPQDLAIIAYDNSSIAALPLVDLASIDQSGPLQGQQAAKAILSRIEGRTTPHHILLDPKLVSRRSLD